MLKNWEKHLRGEIPPSNAFCLIENPEIIDRKAISDVVK
jgi:hypothetical protein